MRAQIDNIIMKDAQPHMNINRVREYIQEYFLYILYKNKIFKDYVFCGGTALRFLHRTKRFSEDLDFILSYGKRKSDSKYLFEEIKKEFTAAGYNIEISLSTKTNVHKAFLKYPGILYELGLSNIKSEKLSIKVEIDTNPPSGGKDELTLYNRNFMFDLLHHNIETLFAGKVHALMSRKYTKGRDWYDLLWYLSKFPNLEPNYVYLNNTFKQTSKVPIHINKDNWKKKLISVVEIIDIKAVHKDISRFLEDAAEIELLTKNKFKMLLDS